MAERVTTGLEGLDTVLHGGVFPGTTVLLDGAPGAGKTTQGLHFLIQGAAVGEAGLYITFEELPEQMYREAGGRGWDLRRLEAERLLRVISISPEAWLAGLLEPDGWLETVTRELQVRRIVVDSVTALSSGAEAGTSRSVLLTVRNAFRRLGVTALLIREMPRLGMTDYAADAYLTDTWMRLGWMSWDGRPDHRMRGVRSLEVLKHRGSAFAPGPHVLRMTADGLTLLPAGRRPRDVIWREPERAMVSTGIAALDTALDGGLVNGATYLLDANSPANYLPLVLAMGAQHIHHGGGLVALLSGSSAIRRLPDDFALFGVDLMQAAHEHRFLALDGYQRPVPRELAPYVMPHHDMRSMRLADDMLQTRLVPRYRWLELYDMNTVIVAIGLDPVVPTFARHEVQGREHGMPVVMSCNLSELPAAMAAHLERIAHGVVHSWDDGRYQYLQITKSPSGKTTEPLVVVPTQEPPFVTLA